MGNISIKIKSSYEVHTDEEKALMHELYTQDQAYKTQLEAANKKKKLDAGKEIDKTQPLLEAEAQEARVQLFLNTTELANQRSVSATFLPTLRAHYKAELDRMNPVMFGFLSEVQKKRLKNQLIYTYYLLYAQYQFDEVEERKYTLQDHRDALELCAQRLKELEYSGESGNAVPFEAQLETEIGYANKALQYVGLTLIATWFVEKFTQFMDNRTGSLVEWMSDLNGWRLYWVWGGSMLSAIFEMIPEDFYDKLEAQANIGAPSPVTGYMSWILYYTRFGINLFLLLKHVYHPSEDELDMTLEQRFTTQWNQRKFVLLNDSIWGVANMLCHLVLYGSGMLGYTGNIATVGLLLMDVTLTAWRFWEENTKHNADMLTMKEHREKLETEISSIKFKLKGNISDSEKQRLEEERDDLQADLKQLYKLEAKANFDWKYKKLGLVNDLVYAVALMLAFSVMCCLFFPPASIVPLTAMIIGLGGAALCFLLTFAAALVRGILEVAQSKEASKLEMNACNALLKDFNNANDPNSKRQLYLQIKIGLTESEYQQRMAAFQLIKMIRSSLIEALIPPVIFISLMFMPIGIGIAVMAAGLAVAIISNAIVNRFEPEHEQVLEFDESEYLVFEENPTLKHFETPAQKEAENGGVYAGLINSFGLNKDSYAKLAESGRILDEPGGNSSLVFANKKA